MEFTDKISALIFALIVIGALVYVVMSRFVVGPLTKLKRGEQIVIAVSIVGILLVIVYAAVELLLKAIQLDAKYRVAHFLLGTAYRRIGRPRQADV